MRNSQPKTPSVPTPQLARASKWKKGGSADACDVSNFTSHKKSELFILDHLKLLGLSFDFIESICKESFRDSNER